MGPLRDRAGGLTGVVSMLALTITNIFGQAVSAEQPEKGIVQAGCQSCGPLPPAAVSPYAGADVMGPLEGPPYSGTEIMGPLGGPPPVLAEGELGGLVDAVPMPTLGCSDCGGQCGEAYCYPGRHPCVHVGEGGGFFHRLHDAICCPDPCYEPRWIPAANAGLFLDYARPRTLTRFRWNGGRNLANPDRNAYFWAKVNGPGPQFLGTNIADARVDYDELTIYNETAVDNFSFFLEINYRNNNTPDFADGASFGDLRIGTKSLLLDSEFIQATFQFVTDIPTGPAGKGVGRSLTALEPSLLTSIRVMEDTYVQGQLAEWIPLGGDRNIAGSILHYHGSLNRVLYRPLPDVQIIGIGELGGYALQAGGFTRSTNPVVISSSNDNGAFYLAPGVRMSVCDKLDVGMGARFMLTDGFLADQLYRVEMRLMY